MRILFLTPNLDTKEGWGRFAKEIIDGVSKKGIETDFLILGNNLNPNPFWFLINILKVRYHAKKCDIIHCFDGYPYGIIGALANIGLNRKLVINGVGSWSVLPLYQKRYSKLLSWSYKKADKILCISNFTCNEIQKKIGKINSEVINLGVDLNKFGICPAKNQNSEKIILGVGALKFRKGYHVSIPAIAKVKEHYPDIKYYIVGNQSNLEYFNKLKTLVEKYGLNNNVEFLRELSDQDLNKLYCDCGLFLLTSVNDGHSFEGFGLVYIEANACAKPVVGATGSGAEDAIKDGYSGFLVPQNDINATSKAILKILDDQELYKKMSKDAIQWAKNHTWENTIKHYIKVYEKLIK